MPIRRRLFFLLKRRSISADRERSGNEMFSLGSIRAAKIIARFRSIVVVRRASSGIRAVTKIN